MNSEYNEKEQRILAEGIWYGVGAMFVSIGIVFFFKIPIEENAGAWGIFLGLIFICIGIYINKLVQE